jgi:hypothetical protein
MKHDGTNPNISNLVRLLREMTPKQRAALKQEMQMREAKASAKLGGTKGGEG